MNEPSVILALFAVLTLHIVHHFTMIEQFEAVKRNQSDIIKYLAAKERNNY